MAYKTPSLKQPKAQKNKDVPVSKTVPKRKKQQTSDGYMY